mgnify:CR=1 FL=1
MNRVYNFSAGPSMLPVCKKLRPTCWTTMAAV